MKKILALFLVLATVLSLMTVGAYAAADNALSVSCKLYDGYTVVTVQKSGTVYYTTDGSKPTSKSKKLNSTRIKVSGRCRVRLVSYVKGKPVEYHKEDTGAPAQADGFAVQQGQGVHLRYFHTRRSVRVHHV
ncbi:MAG: chitobiase/beta-hexosaminidase C-terminal domain-containing protein [Oscillospiraceae bacterium]